MKIDQGALAMISKTPFVSTDMAKKLQKVRNFDGDDLLFNVGWCKHFGFHAYANTNIKRGIILCCYEGEVMFENDPLLGHDDEFLRLERSNGLMVVIRSEDYASAGRFVSGSPTSDRANCEILRFKYQTDARIEVGCFIVASSDIQNGAILYAYYGSDYPTTGFLALHTSCYHEMRQLATNIIHNIIDDIANDTHFAQQLPVADEMILESASEDNIEQKTTET